jgi:hypothetical protein
MTRRESSWGEKSSGLAKVGERALALPNLKPAKPAKGWSWEGVGERVIVGEVDGVAVLLLLLLRVRGEGEAGDAEVVESRGESEKTVRSFWRERAGERRVEGMMWCWILCVELR